MPSPDMNRLMDHARIRLPGALDSAIQMELFSAMDEFFNKTNLWYEDIAFQVEPTQDSRVTNPDAYDYDLIPDTGTITRLIGVVDSKGFPVRATMPVIGCVRLTYSPNETQTYTARVALTVADPVTRGGYPEFPDWVLARYGNDLLEGVLGRMMSQMAKPYSSAAGAQFHLRNFKSATAQAKVEAAHQNVYRAQNWRFPQTFGSRRY
jgi:hypothetical protein